MIILLIIGCLFIIANIYLYQQFPLYIKDVHDCYDACIVLGSPARIDGSLSRMQKSRMDRAITLYHQRRFKKLIISGGSVANTFVEAKIMADYAMQQGVSNADILLEEQARNTYENLKYTQVLCQNHQLQSVIVVTSCFHVRRAGFFVKKFFCDFTLVPTLEKEKWKHYVMEYLRMWNTLYYEYKLK